MKGASGLVVPCHWNYDVLETIKQQNIEFTNGNLRVTDMYGGIPGEAIGNGRSPKKVLNLAREEAVRFRETVRKNGIKFNYLLNNSLPFGTKPKEEEVREYTDWIIGEFRPDAIVIASLDLMKMIRNRYGDVPIHVSTIAGVSKKSDVDKYIGMSPEKIIVHNDLGRNFTALQDVVGYTERLGVGLEVMCTESCLRECSWMDNHRDLISVGGDDSSLMCKCNCQKISEPAEILRANFIRPEDVKLYEEMGLSSFKITGRSKPPQWLPEVTRAYLGRSYDGNLIRLLGIDPNLKAEDWMFVDNKSLNGFIQDFPKTGIAKDEIEYCNLWANKLFSRRNMMVNGFSYNLKDGGVMYLGGEGGLDSFRKKHYPRAV